MNKKGKMPMLASWRSAAAAFDRPPIGAGRRIHLLPAAAGVIVVLALAASGCSGGSTKAVAVTATTPTTTVGPRGEAFIQCMQSHGVKVTSLRGLRGGGGGAGTAPTTLPAGVTAPQFQQAMQACRSQLPTGGQNFQNSPAFAAYRNCLTLHGVTLPQPPGSAAGQSTSSTSPGGGPGGPRGLGGLNRADPVVQAATAACAQLRPSGGAGASTTSTS